jgi:phosphoesterase RecJ-like protein
LKNIIEKVSRLKRYLASPAKIVITNHQGPDGDAMGSATALFLFLTKLGHSVSLITPNDYPEFLHWLPVEDKVVNYMHSKALAETLLAEADFIFHLDYNSLKRSADMTRTLAASKAVRIMIDHHPNPDMRVELSISEPEASSTCEIIYNVLKKWHRRLIDKDIATAIYTGLMTDTGCFCFPSANKTTFEVAAELSVYGIDRYAIYDKVYHNFSAERMRLMGYCLNEAMEVFPEYHTAIITLSLDAQQRYNFKTGDSEGFVNLPLSIAGIRFSAFFLEKSDKIKISFRSKGTFSVNDFSRSHFNGGGHVNAAGGDIYKLSLDETVAKFKVILPDYKDELETAY